MVKEIVSLLREKIGNFHDLSLSMRIFLVINLLVIPFLILFFLNSSYIAFTITMKDFVILFFILVAIAMMVIRRKFKHGICFFIMVSVLSSIYLSSSGDFDVIEKIWLFVYSYPLIAMLILGAYVARKKIIYQKQLYTDLFENVTVGIYRASTDGKIIKANQKMAAMFDYDSSASFLEACSRAGFFKSAVLLNQVAEIIREKGFINGFERKVITKAGREITIKENIRKTKSYALFRGKAVCYEGTIEDVSDLKETEEQQTMIQNDLAVLSTSAIKIAASENNDEIFRVMLEQLSVILNDALIFVSDIRVDTLTSTVRFCYMRADLKESGIIGDNKCCFSGKTYNVPINAAQDLLTGEIITLDAEQSRIINESIFENNISILNKISPVKNYLMGITWNKKVFATICIIITHDNMLSTKKMDVIETLGRQIAVIMDRNVYMKGIKRQADFIELLNDTLPVPVFYRDRDGKFLGCNRYFEEFTGHKRENLIGKYDADILFTENITQNEKRDKESLQKGEKKVFEAKIRRADGMIRTATFFESVYFNASNATYGTIAAFVDKTDEKELLEKLTKARADAESVARLKSEFLTTVSHEMRTPLTTIIMISEMLQKNSFDNINELREILAEAAERLFELIENIIDASLMQDGKFFIEEQQFRPQDVYNDLFNVFIKIAANKNLELIMDVSKDLPQEILGDRHRFFQVLKQIISNAIKFTREGKVIVKAGMDKNEKDESKICLVTTITDTGIGIPVEKQKSLSEFFNQADGSLSREFSGSGIGLALAKRITELMGGGFKLSSKPDQGSQVSILIPFRLPFPI